MVTRDSYYVQLIFGNNTFTHKDTHVHIYTSESPPKVHKFLMYHEDVNNK